MVHIQNIAQLHDVFTCRREALSECVLEGARDTAVGEGESGRDGA